MPASESSSGATAVVDAAESSSAATHDHLSAEIFSHTEQEAAWACDRCVSPPSPLTQTPNPG